MITGADPLDVLSGDSDQLPAVSILLALLNEAEARVGAPTLASWARPTGPGGARPLDLLLKQDFRGFEAALEGLAERGFVVRKRA